MAKQAKAPTTAIEAIKIIDVIVPMIALDVRRGIEDMELLEAGNKPVTTVLRGVEVSAIRGHSPVQNALTLTLVLAMSRIFDLGNRPIEQQNKASLPLLAHYLGRQDVEAALLSRTSRYTASVRTEQQTAISAFSGAWLEHQLDADLQDALRRLRLFRDYEVAHSLFGVVPGAPTYEELFRIVGNAAKLVGFAEHATGHEPSFFDDFRADRKGFSTEFWNAYVVGVKALGSP